MRVSRWGCFLCVGFIWDLQPVVRGLKYEQPMMHLLNEFVLSSSFITFVLQCILHKICLPCICQRPPCFH